MDYDTATMKPFIFVDDKQLPEIKNWSVGETYELIVKVSLKNVNVSENRVSADLQVEKMMVPEEEEKDIDDMSNEEFMNYAKKKKRQ